MAHRVLADAAGGVELTQMTTAVGIILQQTVRRSLTNRMFAFYRRHIHKTATFIVLHPVFITRVNGRFITIMHVRRSRLREHF